MLIKIIFPTARLYFYPLKQRKYSINQLFTMEPSESLIELLKGLDAKDILDLIAYAKTGQKEIAVSPNTLKDAVDALEWFIEGLGSE